MKTYFAEISALHLFLLDNYFDSPSVQSEFRVEKFSDTMLMCIFSTLRYLTAEIFSVFDHNLRPLLSKKNCYTFLQLS